MDFFLNLSIRQILAWWKQTILRKSPTSLSPISAHHSYRTFVNQLQLSYPCISFQRIEFNFMGWIRKIVRESESTRRHYPSNRREILRWKNAAVQNTSRANDENALCCVNWNYFTQLFFQRLTCSTSLVHIQSMTAFVLLPGLSTL